MAQEGHQKRQGGADRKKLEAESKKPGHYGWSHEQSARTGMHSFTLRKLNIDGGLQKTQESPSRESALHFKASIDIVK